jgi:LPXTG-motif cell wall-anchored protein
MKKIISNIFSTIGLSLLVLGVLFHSFPSQGYAEDLELIGKDIGLVVEPRNTRLFDLTNLNPGDRKSAKLTIKNSYNKPFNLYMRAEKIGDKLEGGVDLFDLLSITVVLRGEEIYKGPIKDFAESNILLGKIRSGDIEKLVATIYLPGPETRNEYQGKEVEVKWIFIAESLSPPDEDDDKPDKPIEILDKEPPKGEPEVPEHPVEEPVDEPIDEPIDEPAEEPVEDVEIAKDEVPKGEIKTPKDKIKLPKTGEASVKLLYLSGTIMILLGLFINRNKK